jgi:hypothetical protein
MRTLAIVPCLLALAGATQSARADVFTVAAGESIQAAVDAALVAGGDNEVRVAAGLFVGQVVVDSIDTGSLRVSGGWYGGFTLRSGPEATVLDGGGTGPVVRVRAHGDASFDLANFSITGSTSPDGAVEVLAWDTADVHVRDSVVRDNHVTASHCLAAGMSGWVDSAAELDISGNRFTDNAVTMPPGGSVPHSTALTVSGGGHVRIASNRMTGNKAAAGTNVASIWSGSADVADNVIRANGTFASPFASALYIQSERVVARRNEIAHNKAFAQVGLLSWGSSIVVGDSLVAAGPYRGIEAQGMCDGIHLTNVTVTLNAGVGLSTEACGGSEPTLTNSILFGNGGELDGAVATSHSLIGVDPEFFDGPGEDVRLAASSRAVDAGSSAPPEGELGSLDLANRPRVQGRAVDLGAFENPAGEPAACRVLDWQSGLPVWPVPADSHACRCFVDQGLQELNCGFMLPDIFLSLRGPLTWDLGKSLPLQWTIDPFTDVKGPYGMSADVRANGKWVPQPWQGPTEPELKQGKLVVEPFAVTLPKEGRGELRTRLEYSRVGAPAPSSLAVEVVLPEPGGKP